LFSLLWPLLTPRDQDVNNFESTLYQKWGGGVCVLTPGAISDTLHILPVNTMYMFLKISYVSIFDGYMKKCKIGFFFHMLQVILNFPTLRNLRPQALVQRNISYQKHQLLVRGLGNMSSDTVNGDRMLLWIFFGEHKNADSCQLMQKNKKCNWQKF
jgi:hypothetical protein